MYHSKSLKFVKDLVMKYDYLKNRPYRMKNNTTSEKVRVQICKLMGSKKSR